MAQENFAVAGDANAATVLLEQLGIERSFQLVNGLGYSRLADMEHFRRLAHTALPGHFDESVEMAKLDPACGHPALQPIT